MINDETRSMLTELASFLDTLPEERFNYATWVGSNWQGNADLSCGTTACAAGWACTLPSYREKGLHLTNRPSHWGESGFVGQPAVGDFRGADAMSQVLDLPLDHVTYLFVPGVIPPYDLEGAPYAPRSDASAGAVAAHIRQYLRLLDSLPAPMV